MCFEKYIPEILKKSKSFLKGIKKSLFFFINDGIQEEKEETALFFYLCPST